MYFFLSKLLSTEEHGSTVTVLVYNHKKETNDSIEISDTCGSSLIQRAVVIMPLNVNNEKSTRDKRYKLLGN